MKTGSIAVPNSNFFAASLAGCIAVQLRVRVSSFFGNAPAPILPLAGQAEFPCVVQLARREDDPQPEVILGDEIVPIDPKSENYFISVNVTAGIGISGGGNRLGGSGQITPPTIYVDYRGFHSLEEIERFRPGNSRDLYGNSRVASFKRWRMLMDSGPLDMTAGFAGGFEFGDCTEYQVIQEAGNGAATGVLSAKSQGVYGAIGPPINSANYGTAALNGSILFSQNQTGGVLPPFCVVTGTAVAGGSSVRLVILGR